MPDDKFNGRYIDQALVKGNWYGISSGPKPQVFTGNIDNATGLANGLEDIRNKALLIISPNESNGHFPKGTYGHPSLITTIRYGNNFYLQRLVDTQGDSTTPIIEYIRTKYSNSSWTKWQRVTSFGDASATASLALTTAQNAAQNITYINTAIGGISTNPSIDSRVRSNTSSINSLNTDYNSFKSSTDLSIMSLRSNVIKALDHSDKIINNDVRAGQLPGIKIYANTNVFTVINQSSVQVIAQDVCNNWGANYQNSMFFVSNGDAADHPVHVEGGSYLDGNGWWAVFDRDYSGAVRINWMLVVFSQPTI